MVLSCRRLLGNLRQKPFMDHSDKWKRRPCYCHFLFFSGQVTLKIAKTGSTLLPGFAKTQAVPGVFGWNVESRWLSQIYVDWNTVNLKEYVILDLKEIWLMQVRLKLEHQEQLSFTLSQTHFETLSDVVRGALAGVVHDRTMLMFNVNVQ